MKTFRSAALAAVLIPAMLSPAQAGDYLTGYAGWYDIVDGEDEAGQLGVEYRFSPVQYGIRPTLGINVTGDGAVYGYGGFNWDVPVIDNQLYLIPNFVAGLYAEGDGKDLGGAIEFRSGIELAYQMPNQHRVGVAFNHISNASIYDKNPGAETLLINYSVPMGTMFR
jgi:lipid A 3-O-deacylase